MSSLQIGEILNNNLQLYRDKANKATNNSIELPEVIDSLIDNKMYRNKFKKLVREGNLTNLMQLAEMAATKNAPSHWFAKVTSKARWEGTLKWLTKLQRVARNAAEVARRIVVPEKSMKAVYKACWKLNEVAVKHAVTASETGKDPFKYFNWLCWRT